MDEYNYNHSGPWDPGVYETGRTRPRKSRVGLIALLLIIIIFLCGVVSILGFLNIRLTNRLNQESSTKENTLSFFTDPSEEAQAETPTEVTAATESSLQETESSFELNTSPTSAANVTEQNALSLQEIYRKAIPSVVSISCSGPGSSSYGTGVILTESGYVVTNSHVVEGAAAITVLLTDERSFIATLVGADPASDLAVLRIDADGLTPAEFGDSTVLQVGDSVAAIGDPLGTSLRGTMTDGIVSAINRDVETSGRTLTLIQTNAALNSGNSGGPLLNCYGQVVGINTMKISTFTDSAGVEGIGFAIPSVTVKEIVDQLINQGYVSGRPTLGITGEGVSTFSQYYYRMPAGLYITGLEAGCPAEKAGIQTGDILISVGGTRITDMSTLTSVLYGYEVGDSVNVIIYRAGHQYRVSLTLHEATT